jgi:asparagine synthase (glutamine-hydrolysing)
LAGTLFLARDRLGIKPLYYSLDDRRLRFASSLQALLAAGGVDTAIDAEALHHHLTLHAVVPAPRTLLTARASWPGHCFLRIDAQGRREGRPYWRLAATRPDKPLKEREWRAAIHDALRAAVRKRLLIADVKVGVLLSGGLDSSLLVALLAEQGVEDLMTFSVGFEDQPEERGHEFEYSDAVARAFRHPPPPVPHPQRPGAHPPAGSRGADGRTHGGPGRGGLLPAGGAGGGTVKVVQSGQGADEIFGGYYWYPKMHATRSGTPLERFRRHYFDRDHAEFLETVDPAFHGLDHTAFTVSARLTEPDADTFIDQVLRMDATMLITDDPVKRVDNMTMAWGLEARVPFLDHELVELAARMPPELKLASDGKHILKSIARGLVPDMVIDRTKGYFPMPALKYVRGDFLEFMRDILDSRACRERGLFQRDYVRKLLAEPEKHLTRIQGSKLWHLALLEFWLRRNVDGV